MARPSRRPPAPPPAKSPRRPLWVIGLAALVFSGVLISRLPARWVLAAAGHDLRCATVEGSLWNGYCGGATVRGTAVGNLSWQLLPGRLLSGRLAAHVASRLHGARVRADVSLGLGGTLTARNVRLHLPLDARVVPAVPPYISGTLRARLSRIELTRAGAVKDIEGRITVRHLIDSSGQVTPLGNFLLTFPARSGAPVGHLSDLGGPLSIEGTVRLTAQPGYDLRARVAARSNAVPSLTNALQFLGSPDTEGRRLLTLSGTY